MSDLGTLVRKAVEKQSGIRVGIDDPPAWISTGCHALDWLMSGRFDGGVPYGQFTLFAGESGAGKSLLCGHIMRHALEQGAWVVLIDTENAIQRSWLERLGIDPEHERLTRVEVTTLERLAPFVYRLLREYHAAWHERPFDERPRLLLVVDSLGMLPSEAELEVAESGETREDHGRRAKRLASFVRTVVGLCGSAQVALVATNHVYASQSLFRPTPVLAGGGYARYGPSIVVRVTRAKLRAADTDADGGSSGIAGVRLVCTMEKTRFHREFEKVEIEVPWQGGLNPWSGFVEVMARAGVLEKDGRRWAWTSPEGERVVLWQKEWERNRDGWAQRVLDRLAAAGPATRGE